MRDEERHVRDVYVLGMYETVRGFRNRKSAQLLGGCALCLYAGGSKGGFGRLLGNPCNWVPYGLNVPRTFKPTFLVFE